MISREGFLCGAGSARLPRWLGVLAPRRWLVEALVAALLGPLAFGALQGWRAADSENRFPEALNDACCSVPVGNLLTVTASLLNAEQPGLQQLGLRVHYVGAGSASTGPFVVSVHPISRTAWAAVALGADGRCFGTLFDSKAYGQYFYAEFPVGTQCLGRVATPSTVTSTNYPDN
jgi:hypothetical protein